MFLNIITPCSRPENLNLIAQSINIPRSNYRWLVVFDSDHYPAEELIPSTCETYLHRNPQSTAGHSQRNFALDMIEQGHVYMNDDDTVLHEKLWDNIKDLNSDFISFQQVDNNGRLRLTGNDIRVTGIDSHNFIVSKEAIGGTRWQVDRYEADGLFATEVFNKVRQRDPDKITYIARVLSTYNSLR